MEQATHNGDRRNNRKLKESERAKEEPIDVEEIRRLGAVDEESYYKSQDIADIIARKRAGERRLDWKWHGALRYNAIGLAFGTGCKVRIKQLYPTERQCTDSVPLHTIPHYEDLLRFITDRVWDGSEATFEYEVYRGTVTVLGTDIVRFAQDAKQGYAFKLRRAGIDPGACPVDMYQHTLMAEWKKEFRALEERIIARLKLTDMSNEHNYRALHKAVEEARGQFSAFQANNLAQSAQSPAAGPDAQAELTVQDNQASDVQDAATAVLDDTAIVFWQKIKQAYEANAELKVLIESGDAARSDRIDTFYGMLSREVLAELVDSATSLCSKHPEQIAWVSTSLKQLVEEREMLTKQMQEQKSLRMKSEASRSPSESNRSQAAQGSQSQEASECKASEQKAQACPESDVSESDGDKLAVQASQMQEPSESKDNVPTDNGPRIQEQSIQLSPELTELLDAFRMFDACAQQLENRTALEMTYDEHQTCLLTMEALESGIDPMEDLLRKHADRGGDQFRRSSETLANEVRPRMQRIRQNLERQEPERPPAGPDFFDEWVKQEGRNESSPPVGDPEPPASEDSAPRLKRTRYISSPYSWGASPEQAEPMPSALSAQTPGTGR